MKAENIILLAAILLSFSSFALSLMAFQHIKPEERQKRSFLLLLMDPWWPFYKNVYEDSGRKYCLYGKVAFLSTILAFAVWVVMTANGSGYSCAQ